MSKSHNFFLPTTVVLIAFASILAGLAVISQVAAPDTSVNEFVAGPTGACQAGSTVCFGQQKYTCMNSSGSYAIQNPSTDDRDSRCPAINGQCQVVNGQRTGFRCSCVAVGCGGLAVNCGQADAACAPPAPNPTTTGTSPVATTTSTGATATTTGTPPTCAVGTRFATAALCAGNCSNSAGCSADSRGQRTCCPPPSTSTGTTTGAVTTCSATCYGGASCGSLGRSNAAGQCVSGRVCCGGFTGSATSGCQKDSQCGDGFYCSNRKCIKKAAVIPPHLPDPLPGVESGTSNQLPTNPNTITDTQVDQIINQIMKQLTGIFGRDANAADAASQIITDAFKSVDRILADIYNSISDATGTVVTRPGQCEAANQEVCIPVPGNGVRETENVLHICDENLKPSLLIDEEQGKIPCQISK